MRWWARRLIGLCTWMQMLSCTIRAVHLKTCSRIAALPALPCSFATTRWDSVACGTTSTLVCSSPTYATQATAVVGGVAIPGAHNALLPPPRTRQAARAISRGPAHPAGSAAGIWLAVPRALPSCAGGALHVQYDFGHARTARLWHVGRQSQDGPHEAGSEQLPDSASLAQGRKGGQS